MKWTLFAMSVAVFLSCQNSNSATAFEIKGSTKSKPTREDTLLSELREHLLAKGWIQETNYLRLDSFDERYQSYLVLNLQNEKGKETLVNRWTLYCDDMYLVDTVSNRETFFYSATTPIKTNNEKVYDPFKGEAN